MRLSPLTTTLLCSLLAGATSCANSTEPTVFGPHTFVAQRVVGETLPSLVYCTPYGPNTEQWVYLHSMSLEINQFDNFTLMAQDEHGSATYTLTAAGTKLYTIQSATGGTRGVHGVVSASRNGSRELTPMYPMAMGDRMDDFSGRISGDSVIVTDRVHCERPVGADSVHVFTVILK